MKFSSIAGLISDMDGVLYRGDTVLPGVHELFEWLNERGIPYVLATNNSSRTRAEYVSKLAQMGIPGVPENAVVTSAVATADYMRQRYPAGTRVYVLGMLGIREALTEAGFDLDAGSGEPVEVVVSGIDLNLTYDKLKQAALYIRAGADFIGTNGDVTLPNADGMIPGAGSLLAALQAATGRAPTIIGKPHAPMFEASLHTLGLPAENVLMLGDRLDTDILGAKRLNIHTALLFTGVSQPEDQIRENIWADVAYEDMPAFLRAWAGDDWYRARLKAKREVRS
jgi:4-nitrophenyl phosphatase